MAKFWVAKHNQQMGTAIMRGSMMVAIVLLDEDKAKELGNAIVKKLEEMDKHEN